MGKIIIVSAPSGSGKSTIINALMRDPALDLKFSVSATNRQPRQGETDGVSYFFMTTEDFKAHIEADDFVEWEEVYPGRFYGTLKSEISRITTAGHNVILDLDVKGGINVKKMLGNDAMSIFIMPPGIDVLFDRLTSRGTDSIGEIERRVAKAELEISYSPEFDNIVVNDVLDDAIAQTGQLISDFIRK